MGSKGAVIADIRQRSNAQVTVLPRDNPPLCILPSDSVVKVCAWWWWWGGSRAGPAGGVSTAQGRQLPGAWLRQRQEQERLPLPAPPPLLRRAALAWSALPLAPHPLPAWPPR
jgi:hypothetical protein